MKQILRRGTLSALLALAVLPAAANAAFTPTVTVTPVNAGCGPKGVNALPSSGGGLPAGVYKYKVEATVGGTDTAPCYEVTTGSAAANAAFLLQWETTPGATQYKVFRNDALVKTIAVPTAPSAVGACSAASATPATSPVTRCWMVDNALNAPTAEAPKTLPTGNTQAGGSPDLNIAQAFDYSGAPADSTDDTAPNGTPANSASLRTNILHFPSGLAAAPGATSSVCTLAQLLGDVNVHGSKDTAEDQCPRASQVGTVLAFIKTPTSPAAAPTIGDVYIGEKLSASDTATARLYVVLRPACSAGSVAPIAPGGAACSAAPPQGLGSANAEVEKSFLSAKATLKQGADQVVTIDNETTSIASGVDEPLSPVTYIVASPTGARTGTTVPIQVQRITQYLFGRADQGTVSGSDDRSFILMPTSCAAETFGVDASSYLDQTNVSASAALQATGCDALAFSPNLSARLLGNPPDDTRENAHPGLEATISQNAGEAAQKTAAVTLPAGLGTNIAAVGNACTQAELASSGGCPSDSQVGTVQASSPLIGALSGPVFLVQSATANALPDLVVFLNGNGASIRLRGAISFNADQTRLVNTFDNIPDTPLSSFKLTINGGANGLLQVTSDLCDNGLGKIDATFTGQNGKTASRSETVQSSLDDCRFYYELPPAASAKRPKLKITLKGVKKRRPTISSTIKRGGTNARDNLRRTRFQLPKGMRFRKGAKKRVVVKVNGHATRAFKVKGRVLSMNQSSANVRRIAISTKKRAVSETKKIRRKGKKQKLTFRVNQKVQSGASFSFARKVRPRS